MSPSAPEPTVLFYRPDLRLHFYRPEQHFDSIVLFFHGGGWFAGDPRQFEPQCAILAQNGIASASAQYRVHSRDKTMVYEAIEDAYDATAYVIAHSDRSRVFLCGASSGGLLATLAARRFAASIAGLVLLNPVLDLSAQGFKGKAVPTGGDLSISPLHLPKSGLPRLLIMHGTKDGTTPIAQSRQFVRQVNACAGSARMIEFDGLHGFFNLPEFIEPTTSAMLGFLDVMT